MHVLHKAGGVLVTSCEHTANQAENEPFRTFVKVRVAGRVNEFYQLAKCKWPLVYPLPVFEFSAILVYYTDFDPVRGPACADRLDIRGCVPEDQSRDFQLIRPGRWQEFTSEVLRADATPFLEVCVRPDFANNAVSWSVPP
jgi:hypothetical protein